MQPMINAIEVEPTGELEGQWRDETDLPVNRAEVAFVEVGGLFHLFGGGTTHHIYDPVTQTWTTGASLPFKVNHIQGVTVGGKIYLLGGLTSLARPRGRNRLRVRPRDGHGDRRAHRCPSHVNGAPAGSAVHDGSIYYAGGLNDGVAVNWFDVYDPVADSWTQLPDMPTARDHFHAATLDGRLWAIGGRDGAINAVTTANEAYDFSTGEW